MAINLWTLGGKPANYNPLPSGLNYIELNRLGDFQFKFRAKSDNSRILKVWTTGETSTNHTYTLTSDFKDYIIDKTVIDSIGGMYLSEYTGVSSDIIIEDIQLVEKPIGNLTINGIDGFNSGLWTLHPNAKVIDDETLELNATANGQSSDIVYKVLPNTTYTISIPQGKRLVYEVRNAGNGVLSSDYTIDVLTKTFTTPTSADNIRIALDNGSIGLTGTFTFKRPMLNLGDIPAPYEPKRGERMVVPVAKKNLFDGVLELGSLAYSTGVLVNSDTIIRPKNFIPIKPNTQYTLKNFSTVTNVMPYVFYDMNKSFISGFANNNNEVVFISPSNSYYLKFRSENGGNLLDNFQLEEGSIATPYEPYTVQINQKGIKRQVSKFDSFTLTADYVDKVSGSDVENPHVGKATTAQTSLQTPNGTWAEFSNSNGYDRFQLLDSSIKTSSTSLTTGLYAQHLFSFNLIAEVERKYGLIPKETVEEKVQWLKDNVTKLTCNWYGFGSSVGGNKATQAVWYNGSWITSNTSLSSSVAKVSWVGTSVNMPYVINSDGFIHFLAYAEPSDSITASTINTDYVELVIESKTLQFQFDVIKEFPKKNLIPFIEQGGTNSVLADTVSTNRVRTRPINVIPDKLYTISSVENKQCHVWWTNVDGSSGVGTGWQNTPYVFNFPNAKIIRILFRNSNDSDIIPSEVTPQLEEGIVATPYEPYSLTGNKRSVQVREALR